MPPLLKTLSACSIYSVKKLVLLSKSERIFGLGAGLFTAEDEFPDFDIG